MNKKEKEEKAWRREEIPSFLSLAMCSLHHYLLSLTALEKRTESPSTQPPQSTPH